MPCSGALCGCLLSFAVLSNMSPKHVSRPEDSHRHAPIVAGSTWQKVSCALLVMALRVLRMLCEPSCRCCCSDYRDSDMLVPVMFEMRCTYDLMLVSPVGQRRSCNARFVGCCCTHAINKQLICHDGSAVFCCIGSSRELSCRTLSSHGTLTAVPCAISESRAGTMHE